MVLGIYLHPGFHEAGKNHVSIKGGTGRLGYSSVDTNVPQHEIDRVAHYCTAALELKRSPFFIEEFIELGLTTQQRPDGTRQVIGKTMVMMAARTAMTSIASSPPKIFTS